MTKYYLITAVIFVNCLFLRAQQTGAPQQPSAGGRGARAQADPIDFEDHPGWTQMFDGKTLNGWDGNPEVWKVVDGTIGCGFSSPEGTRNPGGFIAWKGGDIADFELKLEIKLEGATADSGIEYRAWPTAGGGGRGSAAAPAPPANPWNLGGYQFDFNFPGTFNGNVAAGASNRGTIAYRGQIVRAEEGKRPRQIGTVGKFEELGGYFKVADWNQIHMIASGHTFTQFINGRLMSMLIDEDSTKFRPKGLIGLQCAGTGTMRIAFRNLWLRTM
ncbi:MAG TPA: DUF1080 domain-containing protein [Bryobacteraceae bacterium]|jgi:hypothetical protein